MKSYINGENCDGLPCVYMKLFNFEIQKCGQILCVHKPYFLMPGHKLVQSMHVATYVSEEVGHTLSTAKNNFIELFVSCLL